MFVGHYAAAMAAKAIEPKAPMWTLAAACQLVDIGWSAFIIAGVEHARVDPALPGSTLVLYDMPWTHSLPAALAWSVAAAVLVKLLLRLPMGASAVVGLTVFSHWALDLLVHRPDLELWPGGARVGLALWNYPVPEQALEIGLLAVLGAVWVASRKTLGRMAWPAIAFIAFLVALQIAGDARAAAGRRSRRRQRNYHTRDLSRCGDRCGVDRHQQEAGVGRLAATHLPQHLAVLGDSVSQQH